MEQSYMTNGLLNPHIWGNICAFHHIFGSSSSYMTLQLLHSEFLIYSMRKILFSFFIRARTKRASDDAQLYISILVLHAATHTSA